MTSVDSLPGRSLAGKYLTFRLAAEDYGIEILKVREIIGMMVITRLPQAPASIRGVLNLRGTVIPVLDLRIRFGLPAIEDSSRTCIIVVQIEHNGSPLNLGILVDEVSEVVSITDDQTEPPPVWQPDLCGLHPRHGQDWPESADHARHRPSSYKGAG